jgi:hypothetical protein
MNLNVQSSLTYGFASRAATVICFGAVAHSTVRRQGICKHVALGKHAIFNDVASFISIAVVALNYRT